MAEPTIAQKSPFAEELEAGKKWWCACGQSKTQPFCGSTHKVKREFVSFAFEVTEKKTYYLCGCKNTKNAPYCDGTHKTL